MAVLSFFLHPTLRNPDHEDYRKAAVFMYAAVVTGLFLVVYDIYFLIFHLDDTVKTVTNIAGTLAFAAGIAYFRYSERLDRSLGVFMLMCSPFSLVSIYHTGGIYSADVMWIALLVVSAYLFINATIGNVISGATGFYLLILYVLETYGAKDFKRYVIENTSTHNLFTFVFVILLISVLLIAFNRILQQTNRKLAEMKQRQIDELEEKIREKSAELNLLRRELAKDFHDEMGNKLASITILSQSVGLKMQSGNDGAEIRKLLNTIEERSIELYHGTKDFIWSVDFNSDYVDEWFIYIRDFGEDFFGKLGISFFSCTNLKQGSNLAFGAMVSRQLIYILKEIMTNTAKHANATQANLRLVPTHDERAVTIVFSDNGKGFDIHGKPHRGINNIRERVSKIKGDITIETDDTNGSTFCIHLSLHDISFNPVDVS